MHIFHSRENIKTCIFTAVKIQDLIFSRERTVILELLFLFSQYGLRETTLYGVSYFYGNVNKSESLRSFRKERAFIKPSATTRKSKQKLM